MSFLERCPSYSELKAVADPWEGPRGVSLDPTEARRAEKNLGGETAPPPLSKGLDDPPFPHPPLSQGLDPALKR